jgi:hypothetical protein
MLNVNDVVVEVEGTCGTTYHPKPDKWGHPPFLPVPNHPVTIITTLEDNPDTKP